MKDISADTFDVLIIAGLGNPGAEYEGTRHNIGFDLVDALLSECGSSAVGMADWRSKFDALVADVRIAGTKVILCKPQTYMNCSGEPLASIMKFHKISPRQCLIIHDEADLPFGAIRLKRGGGEAGHNGLRSVSQRLGTKDYLRLRVGVGRPSGEEKRIPFADWILRRFSTEEANQIPEVLRSGADFVKECFSQGVEKAMSNFHS